MPEVLILSRLELVTGRLGMKCAGTLLNVLAVVCIIPFPVSLILARTVRFRLTSVKCISTPLTVRTGMVSRTMLVFRYVAVKLLL